VNHHHYAKLRQLHERHAGDGERFHERLFCLLTRYRALGGDGFQAAVCPPAFQVLREHLQVSLECFASPLNAFFPTFGSAFPDVDAAFGSLGSFFEWNAAVTAGGGSFEANPPFIPAIMAAAVKRMHALLEGTTAALSFVVVVPGWTEDAAWAALRASPFRRAHWLIAAADHGFCDGAQHKRQDLYRESPFDTGVFVLQNDAGQAAWPVSPALESELRAAFAAAVPSAAAVLRRARDGRGFADADGGGGVYKGKRKNAKKPSAAAAAKRAAKTPAAAVVGVAAGGVKKAANKASAAAGGSSSVAPATKQPASKQPASKKQAKQSTKADCLAKG